MVGCGPPGSMPQLADDALRLSALCPSSAPRLPSPATRERAADSTASGYSAGTTPGSSLATTAFGMRSQNSEMIADISAKAASTNRPGA